MPALNQSSGARPGLLQLWFAHPGDLMDEAVAQQCAALLDEGERTRAARFHFDRNRREYIATHALARTALSRCHAIAPQAWQFPVNAHGKPAAAPDCGLRFNLSNSVGLVACLVAHVDVGVDLEPLTRAEQILPLAPDVFSPAELAQLRALPSPAQPDRAVSLWTLKEAYIKARGMGLALPLKKFSFLFGGAANRGAEHAQGTCPEQAQTIGLEIDPSLNDTSERWRFCLLAHAGHRVALMVERAAPLELEVWEARPPIAAGHRLPDLKPRWFPSTSDADS